jgi:hypothetical protein
MTRSQSRKADLVLPLHAKQGRAFQSKATEILYGGAAGGGKSHLFRVAAIAWCLLIPGLQVYIFRRLSPDLWKNHMEGPGGFPELLAPLVNKRQAKINESKGQIRFPNGSVIHLCHCQYEKNVTSYQGAEIHVLIIDELTQWTSSMYRYLRGRVRLGGLKVPEQFKGLFPRVLAGANPGGIGHNWVKAGWIDLAAALLITRMPKKEGGMLRQFVPALLEDNPTMAANDPDYESRLEGLGNAALVRAMRKGDWNIVAGGAFDDVWTSRIIVPRFQIPSTWRIDRSHDWGSSKPFANLWFGESDGTEAALPDGRKFCPPRGSLVVAHEWYGAKAPNEGLRLAARDVGKGIIEREQQLVLEKWFPRMASPGPADNAIRNVADPGTPTIEQQLASGGATWTESDKAPGTRRIGLELVRGRIAEGAKPVPEAPALYIMDHCRGCISRWPVLPRDPKDSEDVDSNAEDHDYDALRYRVLAAKPGATDINLGFAH